MQVLSSAMPFGVDHLWMHSVVALRRASYQTASRFQQIDSADGLGVVTYLGRSGTFALRDGSVSRGRRKQQQSVSGGY